MTPAERLLKAADLLDKRASEATEGPWTVEQDFIDCGVPDNTKTLRGPGGKYLGSIALHSFGEDDARYIATMHPEVGKALALWLRGVGTAIQWDDPRIGAYPMEAEKNNALAVADLLLAGDS